MNPDFNRNCATLLRHPMLKGFRHKFMDAYARAIRRIGECFDYHAENLPEEQLDSAATNSCFAYRCNDNMLELSFGELYSNIDFKLSLGNNVDRKHHSH